MMMAVMTPPVMVMAVVAVMAPVMVMVVTMMMVVVSVGHIGGHGRRRQQRDANGDRREEFQHSYSPGSTWG
jgi:hypothetical protein